MANPAVAVIGAGSIGAATGLALAREGVSVTLFDRYLPPHSVGAHAGESRLVRSLPYLEKSPGEAKMLLTALQEWEQIQHESGTSLISRCGGLAIDQRGSLPLSMMRAAGQPADFLETAELQDRFPQFLIQSEEVAVFDALGGTIDPAASVAAMIDLARKYGAETKFNTGVIDITPVLGGVLVRTATTIQRFERVVMAAGAFSQCIEPGLSLRARRLLLGWFTPKAGTEHLLATCPSFVWAPTPGSFLYGGASYDGRTLKVGMDYDWGNIVNPASNVRDASVEDIAPLKAAVARHLPWLAPEGDRFEMHIDSWSTDARGILGERPGREGIVLATGWSGYGFKIAPAVGLAAADLVLGRPPRFDISALDPTRLTAL